MSQDDMDDPKVNAEFLEAARGGDLQRVVAALDERRADLHAQDQYGYTALHLAAWIGQAPACAVVSELIRRGLSVETKGCNGGTALHCAAMVGALPVVLCLLDEHRADPHAVDDDKWSALHHAALYGHEAVVVELIRRGCAVDAADNDGETPLMDAARSGHLAMVRALIERGGADHQLKNNQGQTAVDIAKQRNHREVQAYLESLSS